MNLISSPVILGNQVLRDSQFDILINHRVAVLTNPTGVFMDTMLHIVDEMNTNENANIIAVFGPEHGFRGDKQAEIGDEMLYVDGSTGLPVYSAYNMKISQISDILIEKNITAIVVDMQDVGVRLYTFFWTMYNVMNAVKDAHNRNHNILFVVCDRPNPLSGNIVDGPQLDITCCASGYGLFPITHIHGLTIGELALLFNTVIQLPADNINVIKMLNWRRDMKWNDTGFRLLLIFLLRCQYWHTALQYFLKPHQ